MASFLARWDRGMPHEKNVRANGRPVRIAQRALEETPQGGGYRMSSKTSLVSRRKFLRAGAAAAGATAVGGVAMQQVSWAKTKTLTMQDCWGKADDVNEMGGGRLKIDYLLGGSVVHPFQVFDGVHGGQIDAAHTVTVYWYGKHKAASLFGTGPVFGFNANEGLGWIHNGGGKELFDEL